MLESAVLQGAHLAKAQLQGADLIFAHLQGANLHRAEFQGADLSAAEFQETKLRLKRKTKLLYRNGKLHELANWFEPTSDESAGVYDLPAALLFGCKIGRKTVGFKPPKTSYFTLEPALSRLAGAWHIGVTEIFRLRWRDREQAIGQLTPILGDSAGELLQQFDTDPTRFHSRHIGRAADLTGVFIDEETVSALQDDDADVPPRQLFEDAVKDPEEIKEGWFRFPSRVTVRRR